MFGAILVHCISRSMDYKTMHNRHGLYLALGVGLLLVAGIGLLGSSVRAGSPAQTPPNPRQTGAHSGKTALNGVPGGTGIASPNNAITRGELAKVALLAFAIPIGSTAQVFADVPPTHPFFSY